MNDATKYIQLWLKDQEKSMNGLLTEISTHFESIFEQLRVEQNTSMTEVNNNFEDKSKIAESILNEISSSGVPNLVARDRRNLGVI